MNKKKFIAVDAAVGLAATLMTVSPAANAEPVANGPVIVGSDTLQDVLNALANGTTISGGNVRSTAGGSFAASFDATGPDRRGRTDPVPRGAGREPSDRSAADHSPPAAQKIAWAAWLIAPLGWVRKNGDVPNTTARAPEADSPETTAAWPAADAGPLVPAPLARQ